MGPGERWSGHIHDRVQFSSGECRASLWYACCEGDRRKGHDKKGRKKHVEQMDRCACAGKHGIYPSSLYVATGQLLYPASTKCILANIHHWYRVILITRVINPHAPNRGTRPSMLCYQTPTTGRTNYTLVATMLDAGTHFPITSRCGNIVLNGVLQCKCDGETSHAYMLKTGTKNI